LYIKEVLKKLKDSEKVYKHLRLVESIRTPKGPRQRTVLHLGNADDLNISSDDYKVLANTIEAKLNNISKSLFDLRDESNVIEELANHFAERISQERLNNSIVVDIKTKSYEEVDVNSIENTLVKSVGVESIAISQLDEYNFDKILKDCGFNKHEIIYAKMLTVSRLAHPSSEREAARYLKEDSAISEILNCDIKIYDNALHRVALKLYKHKDIIENHLSMMAKDKFSLEENIILYDLTNTYLEGRFIDSNLAQYGRSKEKRSDAKLITLALMTDSLGFPKKSKILKGNISEPGTLKDFLDDLEKENGQLKFSQKNIIMDAGIATQANLDLISKSGLNYIAVSRKKKYADEFFENSVEEEFALKDGKTKLTIKTHKTKDEIYLLCHSPLKAQTEESILKKRKEKFEEELNRINDNFANPKARKKYDYILQRIGGLKERYKVGMFYNISFDLDETNKENIKVNKIIFKLNNKNEERNEDIGKYVLRTNNMSLTTKEISEIYRSLVTIESSFRSMKSDLDMNPIFHKKDKGIEAHLFANILAYHIVIPIITKLRKHKINHTWKTIRTYMSTQYRLTTNFKNREDKQVSIRTTTKATMRQSQIYKALNIKKDRIGNKIYKEV
jgi:hypothetical protein